MSDETFTPKEVAHCLDTWLKYGEDSLTSWGHRGYFSGDGWAARCLRWHRTQFEEIRERNEYLESIVCLMESENVRLKDLCRDLTAALEAAPVYGGRTNAEGEWGREVVERDALIARARRRV